MLGIAIRVQKTYDINAIQINFIKMSYLRYIEKQSIRRKLLECCVISCCIENLYVKLDYRATGSKYRIYWRSEQDFGNLSNRNNNDKYIKSRRVQDTSGNLIIKEDSNTITIGASGGYDKYYRNITKMMRLV